MEDEYVFASSIQSNFIVEKFEKYWSIGKTIDLARKEQRPGF